MSNESQIKEVLSVVSILIVDDDAPIAELIKSVLSALGFSNIYTANTMDDAEAYFLEHDVDLVITDWEMEEKTGIDFTNRIRNMEGSKRLTPIIMLSGHSEKIDIECARKAGITEYVIKPFTAKALCSRIVMIIESPKSFIISPEYTGPSRRIA